MEQAERTSRRSVLAAAAGGAAALAAAAIVRPDAVRAGVDGDLVLDAVNGSNGTTILNTSGGGQTAIVGRAVAVSGGGVGLAGFSEANLGRGVVGECSAGWGVYGRSDAGTGVRGVAPSAGGRGVYAESAHGTALYAKTVDGVAALVEGRILAPDTSGVARIKAGKASITITPDVAVTAGSFLLLTPKTDIGSRRLWFSTNATANTFTIRMSSSRTTGTPIAWLLLG